MYYENLKGFEHKVAILGLKTSICWQSITKSEQGQAELKQSKRFGRCSGEV